MVAFLVAFLRLAIMDFICVSVSFGLVDEGLVRALPFWAFPWPFFYFGVPNWNLFLVSPTLVRRFGGLSVSVGVWYWIWFPLYGGAADL